MLCAAEPDLVSGLLLLSYPLHPPRKPEQLRIQHLSNLRTQSLFVHGTRDPFGSIEEINRGGLRGRRGQPLDVNFPDICGAIARPTSRKTRNREYKLLRGCSGQYKGDGI